jgi:uncharacterized repeat protein (TIGR02543 family)
MVVLGVVFCGGTNFAYASLSGSTGYNSAAPTITFRAPETIWKDKNYSFATGASKDSLTTNYGTVSFTASVTINSISITASGASSQTSTSSSFSVTNPSSTGLITWTATYTLEDFSQTFTSTTYSYVVAVKTGEAYIGCAMYSDNDSGDDHDSRVRFYVKGIVSGSEENPGWEHVGDGKFLQTSADSTSHTHTGNYSMSYDSSRFSSIGKIPGVSMQAYCVQVYDSDNSWQLKSGSTVVESGGVYSDGTNKVIGNAYAPHASWGSDTITFYHWSYDSAGYDTEHKATMTMTNTATLTNKADTHTSVHNFETASRLPDQFISDNGASYKSSLSTAVSAGGDIYSTTVAATAISVPTTKSTYTVNEYKKTTASGNAYIGGTSATNTCHALTVNRGSTVTVTSDPAPTGYAFDHITVNGTTQNTGYAWMATAAATVIQWYKPVTFYIKYNPGYGSGAMSNSSATYDATANLTANGFTAPAGYEFKGWVVGTSASYDAAVTYANSQTLTVAQVNTLYGSAVSGTVNLCAVWKPLNYTVTYDYGANGGTAINATDGTDNTSTKKYTVSAAYGSAAGLTFTGTAPTYWSWVGWNTSQTATAGLTSGPTVTTSGAYLYGIYQRTFTGTFWSLNYSGSTSGYYNTDALSKVTVTKYNYVDSGNMTAKVVGQAAPGWKEVGWVLGPTPATQTSDTVAIISGGTFTIAKNAANPTYCAVYSAVAELIYNANNGNGAPATQNDKKIYAVMTSASGCRFDNATYTLSSTIPTRDGYTFVGWSTNGNDNTAEKNAGDSIVLGNGQAGNWSNTNSDDGKYSLTLYACWTPISYTVTFNYNPMNYDTTDSPISDDGTTSKSVSFAGTYGTLPAPTRPGYNFDGWYLSVNTSTNDFNSLITSTSIVNTAENHDLYAKWSAISYKLTVTANPAEGASATIAANSLGEVANSKTIGQSFPLITPNAAEGYWFVNWTQTDGLAAPANLDNDDRVYTFGAGDGTATANFAKEAYTLTFKYQDGVTADKFLASVAYGTAITDPIATPVRTGYTFGGWYTEPGCTTLKWAATPGTMPDLGANGAALTVYAKWTANSYTIKYTAGTGANGTIADAVYTYGGTAAVSANADAFTKTGYTYDAFSVTGATDGTTTVSVGTALSNTVCSTKDGIVTLTPIWTANTYTVTYAGNGSDGGATANSQHTYDVSKALTANGYTRTGYDFKGWAVAADPAVDAATDYTDSASVSNLTSVNNDTVTLYAVWVPCVYVVTFDSNGGTDTPAPAAPTPTSKSVTYDAAYGTLATVTRSGGWEFIGWFTDPAEGDEIIASTTVHITGPQTLYAHWKPDTTPPKVHILAPGVESYLADLGLTAGQIPTANLPTTVLVGREAPYPQNNKGNYLNAAPASAYGGKLGDGTPDLSGLANGQYKTIVWGSEASRNYSAQRYDYVAASNNPNPYIAFVVDEKNDYNVTVEVYDANGTIQTLAQSVIVKHEIGSGDTAVKYFTIDVSFDGTPNTYSYYAYRILVQDEAGNAPISFKNMDKANGTVGDASIRNYFVNGTTDYAHSGTDGAYVFTEVPALDTYPSGSEQIKGRAYSFTLCVAFDNRPVSVDSDRSQRGGAVSVANGTYLYRTGDTAWRVVSDAKLMKLNWGDSAQREIINGYWDAVGTLTGTDKTNAINSYRAEIADELKALQGTMAQWGNFYSKGVGGDTSLAAQAAASQGYDDSVNRRLWNHELSYVVYRDIYGNDCASFIEMDNVDNGVPYAVVTDAVTNGYIEVEEIHGAGFAEIAFSPYASQGGPDYFEAMETPKFTLKSAKRLNDSDFEITLNGIPDNTGWVSTMYLKDKAGNRSTATVCLPSVAAGADITFTLRIVDSFNGVSQNTSGISGTYGFVRGAAYTTMIAGTDGITLHPAQLDIVAAPAGALPGGPGAALAAGPAAAEATAAATAPEQAADGDAAAEESSIPDEQALLPPAADATAPALPPEAETVTDAPTSGTEEAILPQDPEEETEAPAEESAAPASTVLTFWQQVLAYLRRILAFLFG